MKINWQAAKASITLSLLFIAVYGTCNWITSLRHDVGSFYFAWERHIPFIPAMIVPYMSIDLFFVIAPFLCHDDRERGLFVKRITTAILIGGAFFLLFPLKYAFERPDVEGWLGVVFNPFRTLDQPYNEFPSLHITLRTILADIYARHSQRWTRWALAVWFSLIGFSTIFTHQHHVVDVIGGFLLAGFCFYLFRDHPRCLPVVCNRRIGIYYLAGAAAVGSLGFVAQPWSLMLLWPAGSLAIIAAAYFGLGPSVFRKERGRLPVSTWLVLGPVLIGQDLSRRYYARECRAWDLLTPRLWIGRKLSNREGQRALCEGVQAVVDLTGEFSEAAPLLAVPYLQLPVLDLTEVTQPQLDEAIEFIRKQSEQGIVYLHCKIGYSRTAAVAGAFLIAERQASGVEEAVAMLRAARPSIVIRPEAVHALRQYEARIPGQTACPALPWRAWGR